MREAAAAGAIDLYYLDEAGFAPTLPTGHTWARKGVRPLVRYEAPHGRRLNAIGAVAPFGPTPRLVHETRLAADGKLDSATFLAFVCARVAGLPVAHDALGSLPSGYRRARDCVVVMDNYQVHKSALVGAARPRLADAGVVFYALPPYSPHLNRMEPEWHAVKYRGLRSRCHATGSALKTAVDDALTRRAAHYAARHLHQTA